MHRLFVAIRPPEEIRDALIDAMDDSPEMRWVGDDRRRRVDGRKDAARGGLNGGGCRCTGDCGRAGGAERGAR